VHRSSSKVVGVATAGLSAAAGLLTIVLGGPAPSWPFLLLALLAGPLLGLEDPKSTAIEVRVLGRRQGPAVSRLSGGS